MIIERKEIGDLKEINKWVLIYGRRKTGKTFLVKNFLDYDEFFFVKRDRTIISERDVKQITYETFISLLERALSEDKTVVVDEFHRLGDEFIDFLQYTGKKGKLILISSTLNMSKRLFESRSPVLGFFAEFPVGLISLQDTLKALTGVGLNNRELLELGILLREPIAVDYLGKGKSARKIMASILMSSIKTIPALTGEIFTEEGRELSAVYEGILRAVANRKHVSTEISSYLFSRKLIKKDDPSLIQPYLGNLRGFGLIRRIRVYGRNKFIYKHVSPLAAIFYYADEKYNISERRLNEKEIERVVGELMPRIVEDNIRELLSEKHALEESIFEAKDFDVDACLLKFNKPEIVVEIKWGEKIKERDLGKIRETLGKLDARRFMLFVPYKDRVKARDLEVIDISDLL
ncbi:MAG: AAA family ATPase [Candidatus Altiarchaeota archaeon]|nr:AAA family ATPase [Candidatus Altiarchaeota archaeon]